VDGVRPESLQADFKLLGLLQRKGCRVEREGDRVTVTGSDAPLRSLGRVDMNDFPDAVLAYAVVCAFADGPTRIENVYNLRIKETDRLHALETELGKLGVTARTGRDWLEIVPGPMHGAEIETYDDHRMAMSFALAGLRVPGVVILDPGCVSKTWPGFFEAFVDPEIVIDPEQMIDVEGTPTPASELFGLRFSPELLPEPTLPLQLSAALLAIGLTRRRRCARS